MVPVHQKLFQIFPSIENLCNKTDFFKIAQLSKQATISIGNDTGPMHIISRGNNPTFIFFTKYSDYKLCGQQGRRVSMIRYDKNNLEFVNHVIKKIKRISKPGIRKYSKINQLNKPFGGLGISILSTPKGVMSDHQAKKNLRTRRGGDFRVCSD